MNYYDAVPLADGSGFHYVSRNRRSGTHAVGYCSPISDCPECPSGFGKEGCSTCDGKGYTTTDESHVHATADEARECFRKYLLDGQREESYSDWTGCEVCDTPTKKGLTTRGPRSVTATHSATNIARPSNWRNWRPLSGRSLRVIEGNTMTLVMTRGDHGFIRNGRWEQC